ncbi:DMT family transporter [Paeniglutamicibacter sp. R2-26]|uniref:DMT family transporter n=1 Tax=Paeniglutamicibacter sp. R2-26 TaxID=3144417 RepID=UPI003EE49977
MKRTDSAGSGVVVAVYLALALVWGASFLFIKVSVEAMSPFEVVLGRLVLGALALLAIMAATGRKWPRERRLWSHMAVVALLLCVAPFLLFAWAGQFVPSGLSSIYNAATPIMTLAATSLMIPSERMTRTKTAGIALGAVGVVVIVGPWRFGSDEFGGISLPAQLACLAATCCYGLAFAYIRKFVTGHPYDAPTMAAMQVSMAAAMMVVATPFVGLTPVAWTLPVVSSLLALGVLGTGIAYIWNTMVVRAWGAPAASTVTYLTPLVGVGLGILVLGESLHWHQPVGGLILVLGILASNGKLAPRRTTVLDG